MKTALLLGGTAEARALAYAAHPNLPLIASLAGVTGKPLPYPCPVRVGGFGGVGGLSAFIARQGIAAVVDATHPFAVGMSSNAIAACRASGVPLLTLARPAWGPVGDWHGFATLDAAVMALPRQARVLATTGRKETAPLAARSDISVVLRSVDPPSDLPGHIESISARGPFTLASEVATMRDYRITHLLTRNAGGESRVRLDAAAALGLPLHIVERPVGHAANSVSNVADALEWLSRVLRD